MLKVTMLQEDAMNMSDKQALKILKPMRDMMRDQHGCPISDAYFALERAIDVLTAQQWIPCAERLPDKEGEYLVTFNDKWHGPRARTLWYGTPFDIIIDRDKWVFYCDIEYGFTTFAPGNPIVAWMPLPEPYKEENNGHD